MSIPASVCPACAQIVPSDSLEDHLTEHVKNSPDPRQASLIHDMDAGRDSYE